MVPRPFLLYNHSMIYLGADHRGFHMKEAIKDHLAKRSIAFEDMGSREIVADDDFVDYAIPVAQAVAADPEEHLGVVICGTGAGVDMAANKVKGARSSILFDPKQAAHARAADAINILALPADYVTIDQAMKIVDEWLDTSVGDDARYQRRLRKLSVWEDRVFK